MKKIVLAVAMILGGLSMQAQEVTQIEIVRNNPNDLSTFIQKDVTFLKSIINLDQKTQSAVEDLMYYKYKTLSSDSVTGDDINYLSGNLIERLKIVLGPNYEKVAAKENAIPYLTGRVYLSTATTK